MFMNKITLKRRLGVLLLVALLSLTLGAMSEAAINGITGTTFNLTAKEGLISTGEGNSVLIWGYANADGTPTAQYPGPTLIINQGATVTVNLKNKLTVPVSIVFPGHSVTAKAVSGNTQKGLLTKEALNGGTVSYTFTATKPGTYTYYSGTQPDLQVEMGLIGAIIVRPAGYVAGNPSTYTAYGHKDSKYHREFLFLLTEMDDKIHSLVDRGLTANVDTTTWWPVYWSINGRTAPDTMDMDDVDWLPTQPYNCMVRFYPGEKVLLRIIGGGRDLHPFHTHGNHVRIIARDGRLLTSDPSHPLAAGADLATKEFTVTSAPGQTLDGIFQWTGEGLGWDFYGHAPTDPLAPKECPNGLADPLCDHGKPFPVAIASVYDITPGPQYSGSPFLGTLGFLPPGQGLFNPTGGFFFMWHSHNENEIVNNNIFVGGMMTMIVVEHPNVDPPIPPE